MEHLDKNHQSKVRLNNTLNVKGELINMTWEI